MDSLLGPLITLGRVGLARGSAAASRVSIAALCGVLAGFTAMAAVGFSLSALWIVVLPRVGPAGAALVLAAILAVLCAALLALGYVIVRRGRQKSRTEVDAEASWLAVAQLFKAHKGAMVLAALIAGMSAGAGSRGGNR
jgi:hypothetical protein